MGPAESKPLARLHVIVVSFLAGAVSPGAFAQPEMFPFSIDQDALGGAPDFSFLNHPLTAADRILVRDGHFYRAGADLMPGTEDDERVRFFGVNLAFSANFPDQADAPRVARRLRKLGVNLVRLHHLDTQPDANPANEASILTTGPYPSLNQGSIRRLRAFLDALKAEGIYVNLNLSVGYVFRPNVDGVPPMPAGFAFPSQSKPLRHFHPRMVELQAEFTRAVLDALELGNDPVLAQVEISNEASLLDSWQRGQMERTVAGEYEAELRRQWNAHLAAHYPSTEALRAAWSAGEPDGDDLLPQRWELEIHTPAQARMTSGLDGLTIQVQRGGAPVIVKQTGFSVSTENTYVAEVEMRADIPGAGSRNVYWDIKQNISPWRTATGRTVAVTAEWRRFRMSFRPAFAMEGIGRFGLSVENVDAALYIRGWRLYAAGRKGLAAGETLESADVSPVGSDEYATEARANDYLQFLGDTDRAYYRVMQQAVREKAGPLVPVAGTQMGYGGLLNLDSHDELDYQDHHFYIDHYNFPNTAWDGRDWRIRDASSAGSGFSQFLNMAAAREAGRPYTVSEFNQPWPNTQGHEIDPALAAFAAFQDWDGIYHFAYSHGRGWDDGVPNAFNLNGDWSRWVSFGQAAWLFRSGAIRIGQDVLEIPLDKAARMRAAREKVNGGITAFLSAFYNFKPASAFVHPVRVRRAEEAPLPPRASEEPAAPHTSDSGELTWDTSGLRLLFHAPRAAGVYGFLNNTIISAGPIDVEPAKVSRGFVTVLVTTLDGEPISESSRLLLTSPGYTLRSQPGSNPPRPQQLINYPNARDWWTLEQEPLFAAKPSGNLNGGNRPTSMERVECYVTLRTKAAALAVYPLNGSGERLAALSGSDIENVSGGFRLHLQADGQALAPWYEIVATR